MAAGVAEVLSDGSTGEWRIVTEGCGIGCGRCDDDGVVHRTLFLQCLNEAGDCGAFLAHSDIDTIDRLTGFVSCSLIEDCVHSDGCLSGLTVTDDEFTLTTSDRNHRVDGFESGLERLCYRLTEDYSGSLALEWHLHHFAGDLSSTVKRLAERVDHASEHTLAYVERGDSAGTSDGHSLFDLVCRSEEYGADIVLLEVHHNGLDAVFKLKEFACFGLEKAVNPDHSVADLQHCADFLESRVGVDLLQLRQQHIRDFTWAYLI